MAFQLFIKSFSKIQTNPTICHKFEIGKKGLTFLGGEWAHNPSVRKDVTVVKLIESVGGSSALHTSRCQELLQLLDINLEWRMHIVSDGERRRAQILLGLLNPFDVLLLDEVTVDLDVLVRADFLKFLKSETESRGATILYAVSKCVLTCLLNHSVLV